MSLYRKFLAGAFAFCLVSGSGVALVAAQAEVVTPAQAAPAAPAAPTAAQQPKLAMAPVLPSAVGPKARPDAPAAVSVPAADDEDQDDSVSVSASELDCLTRVIIYEAGAESRAGQLAVAQVVLNRMNSGRFPRTICGVIHQRGQFSAIRSFNPPRNARWQRARAIAMDALEGERAPGIGSAMYFHAAHVGPFRGRTRVARLGGHIFYR